MLPCHEDTTRGRKYIGLFYIFPEVLLIRRPGRTNKSLIKSTRTFSHEARATPHAICQVSWNYHPGGDTIFSHVRNVAENFPRQIT